MKRLFLLPILLVACAPQPPAKPKRVSNDPYPVVRVIDGDTIVIRKDGREEKVRLLRVNTPERGRPLYEEATAKLRRMLDGQNVDLEYEGDRKDPYGRTLAYVLIDGRLVNVHIVRLGMSKFFDKYGQGKYVVEFQIAESEARAAGRGVWRNQ
jgi:micrococcal nuclease